MSKKRKPRIDNKKIKAIKDSDVLWWIVRGYTRYELHPLLKEIRKKNHDEIIKISLMNYLIVRTITVFESFMLNLAVRYVREHKETAMKLLNNPDLDKIAEQLVSTHSFMNKDEINRVFSSFLGKDFFIEIKNQSIEYATDYCYEEEHIHWASPLHKNWDKFEAIFEIRNDIVHHNKLFNLPWKPFRDMIESVLDFMMCSTLVLVVGSEISLMSPDYKKPA